MRGCFLQLKGELALPFCAGEEVAERFFEPFSPMDVVSAPVHLENGFLSFLPDDTKDILCSFQNRIQWSLLVFGSLAPSDR